LVTSLDAARLAHHIVEVASDKKASNIVLLNVRELTTIADYFVICSGQSERQVQAVAEAILETGESDGRQPIGVEGLSAARWVLVDFGDVIAHVFTPEEREYYKLERLWGDAPIVVHVQ
jgi:ribosome-associated protein